MPDGNSTTTLADVARIAGVSKMTVSNVINNKPGVSAKTRVRVLEVIEQSGYVMNSVARVLAGHNTNMIGVLTTHYGYPYMTELITGASQAAENAGFDLALFSTSGHANLERERAALLRTLAAGVLLILPVNDEHQIFMDSVPVVMLITDGPYSVQSDNQLGGRLAAEHLLSLGHTRIGLVTGEGALGVHPDVILRQQSFLETLHAAGVSVPLEYQESGHLIISEQPAKTLLSLPEPPTAIFALNDMSALGVLQAAQRLGVRVPEDLSVIGFDDVPEAALFHPALTTVRQPLREMGAHAMQMLLELIHGKTPANPHLRFPTQLIIRESTTHPSRDPQPKEVKIAARRPLTQRTRAYATKRD